MMCAILEKVVFPKPLYDPENIQALKFSNRWDRGDPRYLAM